MTKKPLSHEAFKKKLLEDPKVRAEYERYKSITTYYQADIVEQEEGGYLVTFPDFPEAITQGDTEDEAFWEAWDCLAEAIANRLALGIPIPHYSQNVDTHKTDNWIPYIHEEHDDAK